MARENLSVGVFDDWTKAQQAIEELRRHGFPGEEIGIVGNVDESQSAPGPPLGVQAPETNVVRGLRMGAIFGAVIGALVILIIPGLGEAANTGRWFEVLGGAALGLAAGGIFFALEGLLFSRAQGRRYESELEQGRYIVTVHSAHRQQEALQVLGREAVHAESEGN